MPGESVDGNDVLAVSEAVGRAVERARAGEGPSLIECLTYRWKGHSKSDANRYRTKEEIESWKERCPIRRFRAWAIETGLLTGEEADAVDAAVRQEISEAIQFAQDSPEPALDTLYEHVYAD